jgi:hypothetical protein
MVPSTMQWREQLNREAPCSTNLEEGRRRGRLARGASTAAQRPQRDPGSRNGVG